MELNINMILKCLGVLNMDELNNIEKILKKVNLFSLIDKSSLNLIKNKIKICSYNDGDFLCKEGETADRMFILISGYIRVLKKGTRKSSVEVTILKAGSIAGIMSLFEKKKRSASLVAKGRVKVGELKYRIFNDLIDKNPNLSKSLLSVLSSYLRKETETIAELISPDEDDRLKIAIFDSKPYIEKIFEELNDDQFVFKFFKPRLNLDTVSLTSGFKVICVFVNDNIEASVVDELKRNGVELVALRCAGYNNVDIDACKKNGISVVRVPAYSPYSVAEHTVALIMALNRHIHKANNRIREGNFSLDGLVGFDMYGKTVGVIGTGKIGVCLINILLGFGCNVLAYDKFPDKNISKLESVHYVTLDRLFYESDIISLHVPLTNDTYHMINNESICKMKKGVMLINTSRGGLVNTQDLIDNLKSGQIGSAGLDVYEEESEYFFEDFSHTVISDDLLARLTTFNNVMVTSHMAFLTKEALVNIVNTTFDNIKEFENGKRGSQLSNTIY
jgi:D-lactate dehydrogenase